MDRLWPMAAARRITRRTATLVPALLLLAGFLSPAHAAAPRQVVERARFVGQVFSLAPAAGTPTSFTLVQPSVAVTIAINPQTQLAGRSAEANVQGLARDDYAVVNARRMAGRWVATRIVYDVDPILPLMTVSGTVLRESADARRIYVRLEVGGVRWITLGRLARYRMDGRIVDLPPTLIKGEPVQLVVNRAALTWIALEVDVRSIF